CTQSSRVGTSTSAAGRGAAGSTRSRMGIANASVLPDPVGLFARTSPPRSASGMTSAWIWKGEAMPRATRSSHTSSETPRERKSVTCLNSFGHRDRVSEEETRSHGNVAHPRSVPTTVAAGAVLARGASVPVFDEAESMLELRDAQFQLVELLTRHKADLARELLDATLRSLPHADTVAT